MATIHPILLCLPLHTPTYLLVLYLRVGILSYLCSCVATVAVFVHEAPALVDNVRNTGEEYWTWVESRNCQSMTLYLEVVFSCLLSSRHAIRHVQLILLCYHKVSSQPCDMSRALFWLDKPLSGGREHGCRICNKNIPIHVGAAYFIPAYLAMWCSYDEACSSVRGKIAFYGGYWRNRKSVKSMNIWLAVLMMTYFLRFEPADE